MNKEEAIEKLKEVSWECEDRSTVISLDYAQGIISQIEEPQKVTIPKFLANWLEDRKSHNLDLPILKDGCHHIMSIAMNYANPFVSDMEDWGAVHSAADSMLRLLEEVEQKNTHNSDGYRWRNYD